MAPCNDDNTMSLAKLERLIADMPKPHPLSGITRVYYAKNMADAARAFVDEYNKPPRMGMPVLAFLSELMPLGYMVGMRGRDETVMLAGPERKKPPEADPGRRFGILSGADYT